jgi:hypothetical protein
MNSIQVAVVAALAAVAGAEAQSVCNSAFRGWGCVAGEMTSGSCVGLAAGSGCLVMIQADRTLFGVGYLATAPSGQYLSVSAGYRHAAAVRMDRKVVAWGNNDKGQTNVPAWLADAAEVTTTYNNSAIIDVNGQLHVWGWGILGLTSPPAGSFRSIDGGEIHFVALRVDGQVVCWGSNGSGESIVPLDLGPCISVAAGGGITSVAVTGHSVAVTLDGLVRCWGNNGFGQCTPPSITQRVVSVAAGGPHSMALLADGSVVCWGANGCTQLQVPGGIGMTRALVAGETSSFALRSCCPCDVFRDGSVNGIDLGVLLGQWGPANPSTVTDFNLDGAVDGNDLGLLLGNWGACP